MLKGMNHSPTGAVGAGAGAGAGWGPGVGAGPGLLSNAMARAPTAMVARSLSGTSDFAIATTAYTFLAIQFEGRDMISAHGDRYKRYNNNVPMIVPVRIGRS